MGIIRGNPLVSFVLEVDEYEELKTWAERYGISVAQMARGLYRYGLELTAKEFTEDWLGIVRGGVLLSEKEGEEN